MSIETDLQPVTYVKDIEPGDVFLDGTINRLYQTEDGRYIATSWTVSQSTYRAHTAVWEADETGYPDDVFSVMNDKMVYVEGLEPDHEAALAKFGYRVVSQ